MLLRQQRSDGENCRKQRFGNTEFMVCLRCSDVFLRTSQIYHKYIVYHSYYHFLKICTHVTVFHKCGESLFFSNSHVEDEIIKELLITYWHTTSYCVQNTTNPYSILPPLRHTVPQYSYNACQPITFYYSKVELNIPIWVVKLFVVLEWSRHVPVVRAERGGNGRELSWLLAACRTDLIYYSSVRNICSTLCSFSWIVY